MSEAAREIIYLRALLMELGVSQVGPTTLVGDNAAAVLHAQEAKLTDRSKHVRLRDFYVRDRVTHGDIRIEKITGTDLVVDAMTKPLPIESFKLHANNLLGHRY